jgi:ParB-like chromosome segregation protein Spo0J
MSEVEATQATLLLATVLCDAGLNRVRDGVPWRLDDPDVVEAAASIEELGLLDPIDVRRLDPPVEREFPEVASGAGLRVLVTHYTYQVVAGFKRFAALQLLGRSAARFVVHEA